MLYPLSYSRGTGQCIKGAAMGPRSGFRVRGLPKPTKSHKFQACEGTLYRSGRPILSAVRASPW